MKAVILAGGLGTRLKPRVTDLPKTLAPINGRPFLSLLLDQFAEHKFTEVIMSIGYLGDKIRTCIGQSYKGIAIKYVEEVTPLGTGGALAFAFAQLDHGDYVVLNGDTYLQLDYRDLYARHLDAVSDITMTLRQVADTARYGRIEVENSTVTAFVEKGQNGEGLINGGVYIMNSGLFEGYDLPEKFSLETDFLSPNLAQLNPAAYITDGYFIDIGIPADFDRTQTELGSVDVE